MGNRAVITASKSPFAAGSCDTGIYLHWNGGRDSIEAFLAYCKLQGFREPPDSYGLARLVQVIANFFGGGLSIGVDKCCNLDCDNWDNGLYQIKGWEIVGRQCISEDFMEQDSYDLTKFLVDLDAAQPVKMQLGKDFITARIVPATDLTPGDKVYLPNNREGGPWEKATVVGIGDDRSVNGHDVNGIPYVDLYGMNGHPEENVNNYLFRPEYRLVNAN